MKNIFLAALLLFSTSVFAGDPIKSPDMLATIIVVQKVVLTTLNAQRSA
jgi:hypothetical protein